MAATIRESDITFYFRPEVNIVKLDECQFYREHLKYATDLIGMKCVDFAVWDETSKTLWLLEVKNYTRSDTEIPNLAKLSVSLVKKIWDSFAMLHLAHYVQQDELNSVFPIAGYNLRLAFHLEFPESSVRFNPEVMIDNLMIKLQQSLPLLEGQIVVYSCRDKLEPALPWQYNR